VTFGVVLEKGVFGLIIGFIDPNTTHGYGFHFQHRYPRMLPIERLAHDSGHNFIHAEYGYPKGSPNTNN
jgi:hypothetical protein